MHTSDTPLYSHPHYQISWHRHDRHPFHHPSIDIHDQDVEMATIPEHGGTENGGKAEKTDNSEKEKMLKEVEPKTDRDPEQALKAQQEDTEEKPKKTSMRSVLAPSPQTDSGQVACEGVIFIAFIALTHIHTDVKNYFSMMLTISNHRVCSLSNYTMLTSVFASLPMLTRSLRALCITSLQHIY